MLYRKETSKSVDQVFADIEKASKEHGFGVLHHYDFKKTLEGKGFALANECRVMEICSPGQASDSTLAGRPAGGACAWAKASKKALAPA